MVPSPKDQAHDDGEQLEASVNKNVRHWVLKDTVGVAPREDTILTPDPVRVLDAGKLLI